VTPYEAGFFKIEAEIANKGYLPTNVTQQAVLNRTAKTVKTSLKLTGAELIMGEETIDLGHLRGNMTEGETLEWMVKATGQSSPKAVITTVSEKGGTTRKSITLK
jgi:hypothetical protein